MKVKLIAKEIVDLQELKEEHNLDTDKEYEVIRKFDDNSVDIEIGNKGKVLNFYRCEYEEIK